MKESKKVTNIKAKKIKEYLSDFYYFLIQKVGLLETLSKYIQRGIYVEPSEFKRSERVL